MRETSDSSISNAFIACRESLAAWLIKRFPMEGEIDDVLQETFIKTLEANRKKTILSPRAYMFLVARNLVFKNLQRRRRVATNLLDDMEIEENAPSMDQRLHQSLKFKALAKAVESLPERSRRVFILKKFYGYSYKEIAKECGISERTVENHIANALKRCGQFGTKGKEE